VHKVFSNTTEVIVLIFLFLLLLRHLQGTLLTAREGLDRALLLLLLLVGGGKRGPAFMDAEVNIFGHYEGDHSHWFFGMGNCLCLSQEFV
jgi:hypothetical protein